MGSLRGTGHVHTYRCDNRCYCFMQKMTTLVYLVVATNVANPQLEVSRATIAGLHAPVKVDLGASS